MTLSNLKVADTAGRELRLSRLLNAPISLVWEVWTDPAHIKNWWGPNGFTNTITKMEVSPEGEWDLVMHGPDGTDYKNKSIFKEVVRHRKLVYEHISGPRFLATIEFEEQGEKTLLNWHMLFESREQFIQVVKTFKADEGLKQNGEKLEHYLQTQFQLRKEFKKSTRARVTTYLNFPGKTEEAFNFYKKVFGGEFTGVGLRRFGDIEMPAEIPALDEDTKKLIIHAELTIIAGHVLMATDSPESMGFKLEKGNNMHINIEPETKEETKKLFNALAEGGTITMPLEDMFWGAYFGTCTDKYGINWMFNCSQ
ncbi:MAG: SRPBCC domain-containing protein [Chitinophagaceae bacterium]